MTAQLQERRLDRAGAACGVAAGALAIAVASILSRLLEGATPPLQALGELTIRATPAWLTRASIDAVGTYDKLLLQVTVLLVALVAVSPVGLWYGRGRRRAPLVLTGVLALVPVLAVGTAPTGSGLRELVVVVPGAVAGLALLRWLADPVRARRGVTSLPERPTLSPEEVMAEGLELGRRQILRAGGDHVRHSGPRAVGFLRPAPPSGRVAPPVAGRATARAAAAATGGG